MPGLKFMMKVMEFNTSIPIRFSAMHHCLKTGKGNLALNNALIGVAMNVFPKEARVRARIHYGSDIELHYQLRGHGFPTDTHPVDTNGNIRTDIINNWVHKYQSMEEAITPGNLPDPSDPMLLEGDFGSFITSAIPNGDVVPNGDAPIQPPSAIPALLVPRRHDVLLGRGRTIQNHLGNVHFREFLKQYSDDYDEAPRNKRRKIATELVHTLKGKGIRFLQQTESGEWFESNFAEAEKKIGQVFRNTRRR